MFEHKKSHVKGLYAVTRVKKENIWDFFDGSNFKNYKCSKLERKNLRVTKIGNKN